MADKNSSYRDKILNNKKKKVEKENELNKDNENSLNRGDLANPSTFNSQNENDEIEESTSNNEQSPIEDASNHERASNSVNEQMESKSEEKQKPNNSIMNGATKAANDIKNLGMVGGKVVSSLGPLLLNPITWIVVGFGILSLFAIAGSQILGKSDFALNCESGGGTTIAGMVIEESEPGYLSEKDAQTNAKVIAGWLSGKPLKANGNKPLNKGQISAIIGNMYAESTLNPAMVQKGFGASQLGIGNNASNEQIKSLNGKYESAVGLVQMTNTRMLTMVKKAESLNKKWSDPESQLLFIIDEIEGVGDKYQNSRLKAGDFFNPNKSVSDYTAIWNAYYERSADCVAGMGVNGSSCSGNKGGGKKRLDFAEWTAKNASSWGSSSQSSSGSGSVTNCSGDGSGLDMSDTVKLALSISYPHNEYSKSKVSSGDSYGKNNALPGYKKAKEEAEKNGGKDGMPGLYASCDRFVATVLKATKADVDIPWGATASQYNYLKSSPKWKEVKCSDRKPGDVLITRGDGHIMLYVGQINGKDSLASASYTDRVAAVGPHISCSGDSWNGDSWTNVAGFRLVK